MLATFSVLALAQATPAGLWRSIDDDGKTEMSIIRITNTNGIYSGKVEKISDPAKADEKCIKCDDERKDKPIAGMTIIWEVRQNAEDPGLFDGGRILDPAKGTSYKLRMKPIDGVKKLEVRGYIGSPMFGRTQTWVRVE